MPGKLVTIATGLMVTAISVLAVNLVVRAPGALALARVVGIPVPDPSRGSHCACAGGICPLDANGRRCSCGCAVKGDAQPLQQLEPLLNAACSDGMAGP